MKNKKVHNTMAILCLLILAIIISLKMNQDKKNEQKQTNSPYEEIITIPELVKNNLSSQGMTFSISENKLAWGVINNAFKNTYVECDSLDFNRNNQAKDIEAIGYLYEKTPQLEKVFTLDSDHLSDGVYVLFLGKVYQNLKENALQPELENLLNELLKQPANSVDKHLERLRENSDRMAYQIAYIMATDKTLTEENKNALYAYWEKLASLAGLWRSVYTMERLDAAFDYDSFNTQNPEYKKITTITSLELSGKIGSGQSITFEGEASKVTVDGKRKLYHKTHYNIELYPAEYSFILGVAMLDEKNSKKKHLADYFKRVVPSEKEIAEANEMILGRLLGAGGMIIESGDKGDIYQQFSPGVIESVISLERSGMADFIEEKDFEKLEQMFKPDGELYDTAEDVKEFLLKGGKLSQIDEYSELSKALVIIGHEFYGDLIYFEKRFTKNATQYFP